MKTAFISGILLLTMTLSAPCGAALLDRGSGLIYDDILDITWLQHANYAESTMTWDSAMSWAENLTFQGYDDWRLPESDTSCIGTGCIGSEMGHLFSIYNITSESSGVFTDVRSYMYWSADEEELDTAKAWRFHFKTGYQGTSSKDYRRYAWAVRDGDSTAAAAPEPSSLLLLISGGLSLAASHLRKRKGLTAPYTP